MLFVNHQPGVTGNFLPRCLSQPRYDHRCWHPVTSSPPPDLIALYILLPKDTSGDVKDWEGTGPWSSDSLACTPAGRLSGKGGSGGLGICKTLKIVVIVTVRKAEIRKNIGKSVGPGRGWESHGQTPFKIHHKETEWVFWKLEISPFKYLSLGHINWKMERRVTCRTFHKY